MFGCSESQTLYVCVDCVKTYCVWVCLLGVVVCALFGCVSWVKASITLPVCIHCVCFGCEHNVFECVVLYTHCAWVCFVIYTLCLGVLCYRHTVFSPHKTNTVQGINSLPIDALRPNEI